METSSLLNYVASGTIIWEQAPSAPAWPAANLQRPEEPLRVWRSTSTGLQGIWFDFGAARQVGLIGVVNVNVSSVKFDVASDDQITTNVVTRWLTPGRCPTGRRQGGMLWTSPPSRRYLRVTFPAQTPTDGAAYFHCGGIWVGAATELPVGLAPDPTIAVVEPSIDVRGVGDGALSRLDVAPPFVRLTCRRFGDVGIEEGIDDEWGAWTEWDAGVRAAGVVGVFLDYGNPAHFWPMRRVSRPRWRYTYPQVSDEIELEESIHP